MQVCSKHVADRPNDGPQPRRTFGVGSGHEYGGRNGHAPCRREPSFPKPTVPGARESPVLPLETAQLRLPVMVSAVSTSSETPPSLSVKCSRSKRKRSPLNHFETVNENMITFVADTGRYRREAIGRSTTVTTQSFGPSSPSRVPPRPPTNTVSTLRSAHHSTMRAYRSQPAQR